MSEKEISTVEKIRSQYEEREVTRLDELKKLDREVRRPADIFAYIFGGIGALILGIGMCLAMPEVIEGYMALGIIIGIVGLCMVSVCYTLRNKLLESRKARYSIKIFELSSEILNKK